MFIRLTSGDLPIAVMGTVSVLGSHLIPLANGPSADFFRVPQNRAPIHSLPKTYVWFRLALVLYMALIFT